MKNVKKIFNTSILNTKFESMIFNDNLEVFIFFSSNNFNFKIFSITKMIYQDFQTKKRIYNICTYKNSLIIVYKNFCEEYEVYENDDKNKILKITYIKNIYIKEIYEVFPLENNLFIYIKNKTYIYGNIKNIIFEKKYYKYSLVNEYLIIYHEKHISIYKIFKNNVLDFKYKDFDKNNYISIRNNKIYFLNNLKVKGHDLNLYTENIKRKHFQPSSFINLNNKILFFDKNRNKIKIYEKNLQKLILKVYSNEFYVYKEKLYSIYKKHLFINEISKIKKDFKLIRKNKLYEEKEDEFDKSDSNYKEIL